MTDTNYWVLPSGICEALPDEAETLEALRRELIDTYQTWGYRLVMPPLVEYMDSLRTGVGRTLDLQTFKVTDQLTGKQLGIRADITPQVARMDAHSLKTSHPNRLCYIGRVLRTKSQGFEGSRSPLQVGVELFGNSGVTSDYEVISLLLETLQITNVKDVVLDIGHIDVFRSLSKQAGLSKSEEEQFFDMLGRKSIPEIDAWIAKSNLPKNIGNMLGALPRLSGTQSVLDDAKKSLSDADQDVKLALDYLVELTELITTNYPQVTVHIDLSELRGHSYHTGIVYAVYTPKSGQEIARGGRYDDIGKHFGNARPATGFSTNLGSLLNMGRYQPPQKKNSILAPAKNDDSLNILIQQLRSSNEVVIRELDGQTSDSNQALNCDRKIVQNDDGWTVTAI